MNESHSDVKLFVATDENSKSACITSHWLPFRIIGLKTAEENICTQQIHKHNTWRTIRLTTSRERRQSNVMNA